MLKRLFASRKRPCFRDNGPWETRRFDLSGCELEITLPPHDDEFPEDDRGERFNVYDQGMYSYATEPNKRGFEPHYEGVSSPGIFLRKWNTYGPFWEGGIGFLQCNAVVCDVSRMNTKLNCFNKSQMERLFIHGLYFSKGPGAGDNEYETPVNWRIKNINNIEWMYCESWAKTPEWLQFGDPHKATRFTVSMGTPLFDDKYLLCNFGSFGTLPAAASNQLMLERIHEVIPSIKLTLSPEAQKQKMDAEKLCPDAEYSQHRNPETWRYYGRWREGDLYAGEDEIVFEGECTPPPRTKVENDHLRTKEGYEMKSYAGYETVKTGAGRPIYVREDSYGLFSRILREHRKNYHFTTVLRAVNQLNAGGSQGKSLNPAGDAKVINSGNISMRYSIFDGAVFIQALAFMKQGGAAKVGLYSVSYYERDEEWRPADKPLEGPDIKQQWPSDGGKAHYAAVAGKFDSIETAGNKLPKHIVGAYQKANLLTKSGAGTGYSLFWSQKGSHKSAEAAEALASVMQQSTQNSLPVNWLIHGEGIHTFTNAAKIIKSSAAVSQPAFAKSADIGKVKKQNVFFSNPASSTSTDTLKRICEDAGLTFLDVHTNNRDLRRWSTLVNVGKEMAPLASKVLAGGGAAMAAEGAIGAVGFEKAITAAFNGLSSGDYLVLGAAVAATGYTLHGAYKRSKVLTAGVKCTFGRGNEEWYTDDDALSA